MKSVLIIGRSDVGWKFALEASAHYNVSVLEASALLSRFAPQETRSYDLALSKRINHAVFDEQVRLINTLERADIFVIAHDIVSDASTKTDITAVMQAAMEIVAELKTGDTILIITTMPVGTLEHIALQVEAASGLRIGLDIYLVYAPLILFNDQCKRSQGVLLGGDEQSTQVGLELLSPIFSTSFKCYDAKTVELAVLLMHSAQEISEAFAREVSRLCLAASVAKEAVFGALSSAFFEVSKPQLPYAQKPAAMGASMLVDAFPEFTHLQQEACKISQQYVTEIIKEVLHYAARFVMRNATTLTLVPRLAVFGVARTAESGDVYNSGALEIVRELVKHKDLVELFVCDPHVNTHSDLLYGVPVLTRAEEIVHHVEMVLILVNHQAFAPFLAQLPSRCKVFDYSGGDSTQTQTEISARMTQQSQGTCEL